MSNCHKCTSHDECDAHYNGTQPALDETCETFDLASVEDGAALIVLEALRELLTSEESPHSETTRYLAREAARAAIAKAEGR